MRAGRLCQRTTLIVMGDLTETTVAATSDEIREEWSFGLPDAELLQAWTQDRQQAALAELIRRYSLMVLSVCRQGCASESDADDAFQTTFLFLARNGGSIRHPEGLPGWLHRVAQRAAVATWKKNRLRREPMGEHPAVLDDPLDHLSHRHEAVILNEELADLPDKYRAVIVLHHYEATPIPELAVHFGTTVGVIRGRLQRGKKLLASKLRQRGLVPAVVFASLTAGSVHHTSAAEAVSRLLTKMEGTEIPQSPIDSSLLQSLLYQGFSKMSVSMKGTMIVGTLVFACVIVSQCVGEGQHSAAENREDTPHAIQFPTKVSTHAPDNPPVAINVDTSHSGALAQGMGIGGDVSAMGGTMGGFPQLPKQGGASRAIWKVDSKTAEKARQAMDSSYSFDVDVPLSDLARALGDVIGQPVLLNERAVAEAKQNMDTPIKYARDMICLRAAMRQMLRPLGMKASIENDGIVITADHAVLAKQGIGTDAWINVDEEMEREFSDKLESKGSFEWIETPLSECVELLAKDYELNMIIRAHELENIGLTAEEPITLKLSNVSLRDAMNEMLSSLDLTLTVSGGLIVITTLDAAEQKPLSRLYWLDGTGLTHDQVIEIIQTTVSPDTWEALGGPSSISAFVNPRAGLMISTKYTIHKEIERILKTLRDSQFTSDPVEVVEKQESKP